MHLYMKEENLQRVQQTKAMAYTRTKNEALETKQEKKINREIWMHTLANEEHRAKQIRQVTMLQKQEAQTKRQMDFIRKQNRARETMEEKLNREAFE